MITVEDVCMKVRSQVGSGLAGSVAIGPDSRLEDLGLSSLQVSDVIFDIEEKLGVELDLEAAAEVETVAELVALLNASPVRS